MGLYPKYKRLTDDRKGAWFAAEIGKGRIVGLSTARLEPEAGCHIDGFFHANFNHAWHGLLSTAMRWGTESGSIILLGYCSC